MVGQRGEPVRRRPRHEPKPSLSEGCRCLGSCVELAGWTKPGLQALEALHRALITNASQAECSHHLDACFEASEPRAPRWDYVVVTRTSASVAIEVHAGNDARADEMLAKRAWAHEKLRSLCPSVLPSRWIWLVPPDSRFTFNPNGHRRRLLQQAGIEAPARRLSLP